MAKKESKRFPNGLTSYLETFYEIVSAIETKRIQAADDQPELIREINDTRGTGGFYELAQDLTDKFENLNKGRAWDGEFFDEVEMFVRDEFSVKG